MRTIRLDETTDWGVQGSDEERAAYEQIVADAIALAYPGTEVIVQHVQRMDPRVVVTSRDDEGRIQCDDETAREEAEIEVAVLEIARAEWEAGEFWTKGEA